MAEKATSDTPAVTILRYREDDLASIALTWFVQVTALAAAITFGIFSVLSWTAAENAKEQANTANLLALAALCGNVDQSSAYGSEVQNFCSQLFPVAWTPLTGAVAKTFPDLGSILPPKVPSETTSVTLSSSTSIHFRPSSSSVVTSSSNVTISSTISGVPPSSTLAATSFSSSLPAPGQSAPQSSSFTSSTSAASPQPTSGASPGNAARTGSAELSTSAKIGLGVGFAIGIPIVFVTALTYLRYRKLRREKVN